jgi:CHAT domain-containing protein
VKSGTLLVKPQTLLAAVAVLTLALAPVAYAQSAADLRTRAEALGQIANPFARQPQVESLTAQIESRIATTPRNTPEWGRLQLALATALDQGDSGREVDERILRAAEGALSALGKADNAHDWALAQLALAGALFEVAGYAKEDADENPAQARAAVSFDQRARAALREALTVFTLEADPKRYVSARCLEGFNSTPQLAGEGLSLQMSSTLQAIWGACGATRYGMEAMAIPMANMRAGAFAIAAMIADSSDSMTAEDRAELAQAGQIAIDNPFRAVFLSTLLGLEASGLSEDSLATARLLRARADRLAPDYFAPMTPEIAEGWRARARLVDLLVAAQMQPSHPKARSAPVLSVTMLDRSRGIVNALPVDAPVTPLLTPGDWPQQLMQEMAQRAIRTHSGTAAGPDPFDTTNAVGQWLTDYRQRAFSQAVGNFRTVFEPAWGTTLASAARQAGAKPGQRLVIAPDGPTTIMPVALLRDPKTGRALIDDYEIVFSPTTSLLQRLEVRANRATQRRIAFVAPPQSETGLAFVPAEVAAVGRHFSGMVTGAQAPKARVMADLRNASYWHFATHGSFNAKAPLDSWLQIPGGPSPQTCVTDGPPPPHCLTLRELLNSEEGLGAPRLVVLSACETGLIGLDRNPDEFIGMPAAFLALGAAGVIASLWEVDDAATTLLMAKLYDLHLRGGETPPAALRHAQLWLRDADKAQLGTFIDSLGIQTADAEKLRSAISAQAAPKPFADPVYWGAFVYFGA